MLGEREKRECISLEAKQRTKLTPDIETHFLTTAPILLPLNIGSRKLQKRPLVKVRKMTTKEASFYSFLYFEWILSKEQSSYFMESCGAAAVG